MNASFDDQASQMTNDQQSETSSAQHFNSPRSATSSAPPTTSLRQNTTCNDFSTPTSQIVTSQQQQTNYQSHQESPVFMYQNSFNAAAAAAAYQHQQDQLRNSLNAQQWNPAMQHFSSKRSYTGVDKLIMAAMMEESAAAAAVAMAARVPPPPPPPPTSSQLPTAPPHYMPNGRGLGYYVADARDCVTQIPTPSNKSELELYRLLEKANLLNYFGTFLNFGGDDVQQLSDADEEEFLEIMSLVGMTKKPLHVRRLQKALIEWRESRDLDNCSLST